MSKLSASAINTFLKSPRAYYWHYIARLEPAQFSVANFHHDLVFGKLWAQFTDNFYKGMSEVENTTQIMNAWLSESDGWVPDRARDAKTKAFESLMPSYYQMFSPDDGVREQSELWMENDRFVAKLDGLSKDGYVHEVKTASRSPSISEQLWKVGNSIQVKLYCVLAQAKGYCIEFAFKDSPYQIFRGPVVEVSKKQCGEWELELNALADMIYSLGANPENYPCHPDGCCMVSKGFVSMCQYRDLCTGELPDEARDLLFKQRGAHK